MAFKIIKRTVGGETQFIAKDGVNGTGVTLPYTCGFCKDVHFRSAKQRTKHSRLCLK